MAAEFPKQYLLFLSCKLKIISRVYSIFISAPDQAKNVLAFNTREFSLLLPKSSIWKFV